MLILMLLFREQALIVAFLAFMLYTCLAPRLVVRSRRPWIAALGVTTGWITLFVLLLASAEIIMGHRGGTDTMVFLFPFMLFPVVMLLAGCVRFFRRPGPGR